MSSGNKDAPIAGYRQLTAAERLLMNENKAAEERVLHILDELGGTPFIDRRWLAIGRTAIEQGFMAVNRAIARPDRIALPDEA